MNTSSTQAPDPATLPDLMTPAFASMNHSSPQNRRASIYPLQRAYPWLLLASTSVAAICCFMYITKPVFTTPVAKPTVEESAPALAPADATLENPSTETQAPPTQPMSVKASEGELPLSSPTPFEETNLRVQHILTAIAPDGQKARIDIEVPVLYQSRKLRWSASEVANARELLRRLSDYQERTRVLQGEGRELLGLWNQLVENSIPASQLRADSPTLPANQLDAADSPRSADLDSTELIQIQPANP